MPIISLEKEKLSRTPHSPEIGRQNRVEILDMLRGFAIIFVMVYHLLYDLVNFGGMDIPFFYSEAMEIIHNIFLVILFFVSGICSGFSRNIFKRGAELLLLGELLTLATAAFFPDNTIVFGVLSCFGSIMLVYGFAAPYLQRLPQGAVFVIFAALSLIFFNFHRDESLFFIVDTVKLNLPHDRPWLYPLGITESSFRSADYFPLIPYGFIFLAGTALSGYFKNGEAPNFLYRARLPIVNFCGMYSLWFYVIHQPIFLAAAYIFFGK